MMVRFKNYRLLLSSFIIIMASLASEGWTYGVSDGSAKKLIAFGKLASSGSGFVVPYVILQLSLMVKNSATYHVTVLQSNVNKTMGRKRSMPSSRNPRFIKELTMMNRQSCLSKILCGVEVSQPPTSSTSTINDYAYLVKSFFDQLSIQSAVKSTLDLDDDATEDEEDDDIADPSDLYEYKKRKHSSYSETMDSFHDEELDKIHNMPLEDILEDNDFKRRNGKTRLLNISNSLKQQNMTNITKLHSSRRNSRFKSAPRGYLGYVNPRFDKTAFLNKKQLELGQASTGNKQLNIAADIAAKFRSGRQCRLLNWLNPSYTTTTTITTTSNTPPVRGTEVSSSTCPFTVPELQKMIIGTQTAVKPLTSPLLANLKLKAPVGKPIIKLVTPAPTTTTTPKPKTFSEYFDDEKNVGPLEIIPELDGVSSYYRPEDDEKSDWFGNAHGDLLPSRFQHRPISTANPPINQFRPRPTNRSPPKTSMFPQRFQSRPMPMLHRPQYQNKYPSHYKPKSRPTPIKYGLLANKPTHNPKLSWTTTTPRPWDELVFNDHLPQYSYKNPKRNYKVRGRPGRLPMDARLRSGLDYMEDENSEESSGENNSEELSDSDGASDNENMNGNGYLNHDNPNEYGHENEQHDEQHDDDFDDVTDQKDEDATRKSSEENNKSDVKTSVEESQESDEDEHRDTKGNLMKENNINNERMKSTKERQKPNGQKGLEESEESDEVPKLEDDNEDEPDHETSKANNESRDKASISSKENHKPKATESLEESEESDEVPQQDDGNVDETNDDSKKTNNKSRDKVSKSSKENNYKPNKEESLEESEDSDEDQELDDNQDQSKNSMENMKNNTKTSTKDSSNTKQKPSLPTGGMLTNLLSDHGRRTLSRISSLFNYGSKSDANNDRPASSTSKPPKKIIRKSPKDKLQSDEDDNMESIEPQHKRHKRPASGNQIRHPSITPLVIEEGESWENDKAQEEEEFYENIKKPTDKPEKYDYEEDTTSNESDSEETNNNKDGIDFGPGQKMNTEYSDVVSSFLKPGDRLVGQDRYVSGLPSSWESIYKEMQENKNNNEKSSEEVNDEGNSDESEEDYRNRRPLLYPIID